MSFPRRLRNWAITAIVLVIAFYACKSQFFPATQPASQCAPNTRHDAGSHSGAYTYLSAKQLWTLYGIEPLLAQCFTGKGQTVVVIDSFGSPTLQSDLDYFSDYYGLPRTTLQILAPQGARPFDSHSCDMLGWAGETTEDVEIIHAIAPDANIVVLTSPVDTAEDNADLKSILKLEQYVTKNHLGAIVSHSFGDAEVTLTSNASQQELAQWDTFLRMATMTQGMTFLASSGDQGATSAIDQNKECVPRVSPTATASFPASSPWVTAVGGTTIQKKDAQLSEISWSGSGGGFSRFYPAPDYQQSLPASVRQQLAHRRGVPDVAASADPAIGLGCFYKKRNFVCNGTSAGAPLWAGLAAIANQMAGHPLGFLNPALYKIAAGPNYARDFHDMTSGANNYQGFGVTVKGYTAVKGWDAVTGLGTPNAQYLLPDLIDAIDTGAKG